MRNGTNLNRSSTPVKINHVQVEQWTVLPLQFKIFLAPTRTCNYIDTRLLGTLSCTCWWHRVTNNLKIRREGKFWDGMTMCNVNQPAGRHVKHVIWSNLRVLKKRARKMMTWIQSTRNKRSDLMCTTDNTSWRGNSLTLWHMPPTEKKEQANIKPQNQETFLMLTSKITIPRATHLIISQLSSRKSYITSKSPVLSVGISWTKKYIQLIRYTSIAT